MKVGSRNLLAALCLGALIISMYAESDNVKPKKPKKKANEEMPREQDLHPDLPECKADWYPDDIGKCWTRCKCPKSFRSSFN
jgi:hypothetical protein